MPTLPGDAKLLNSPRGRLFVAYVLGLCALPLFFGANRDWVWAMMLVFFTVLTVTAIRSLSAGRMSTTRALQKAQKLVWLALAFMAFGVVQMLPWFGPAQFDDQARAWTSISLDPFASARQWCKYALYLQIWWLGLLLINRYSRARALILALCVVGVLQATAAGIFSLAHYSFHSSWFAFDVATQCTGTFVNRNHFAGYLEILLGLGIGLLVSELKVSEGGESWRQKARNGINLLLSRKTQIRLGLLIMVIALVLTRSRMGNTAFFVALLSTAVMTLVMVSRAPKSLLYLVISLIVIDIVVIGSWFGVDQVAQRLQETNFARVQSGDESIVGQNPGADSERLVVAESALAMFQDHPFFGIGAGGFRSAFPRYRSAENTSKFYDHAHNDYVQFLAEYGFVGALMLAIFAAFALLSALRTLKTRRDQQALGLAFGSLLAITAIGIHSTVDFNMQIPANAGYMSLVFCLAFVSLQLKHTKSTAGRAQKSQFASAILPIGFVAFCVFAPSTPVSAHPDCDMRPTAYLAVPPDVKQIQSRVSAIRSRLQNSLEAENVRRELAQNTVDLLLLALRYEATGNASATDALRKLVSTDLADTAWRVQKMASQGDGRAMLASSELLRLGILLPANPMAGCALLRSPNAVQLPDALYRRALCLTTSSPKEAIAYMQRAADSGQPQAQEVIGNLCWRRSKPDVSCALHQLCRAAAAGRAPAAAGAAWLLSSDLVESKDYGRSLDLYLRAASAGDLVSQNNLGEMQESGVLGRQNLVAAEDWYGKAAKGGFPAAQLNLARMLLNVGDSRRRQAAIEWLRKTQKTLPGPSAQIIEEFGLAAELVNNSRLNK
jgi:putative inorganic carbon (hco3(-)) transporter